MKTHLHFHTADLETSVAFYRTLLNAEPAKYYDDYALFITDQPGLELALTHDRAAHVGESAHFGVAVESSQAVDEAIARLQAAQLRTDVQRAEKCCYAMQTKVWSTDPDGRRWEIYTVLEDTEESCCAV